MAVNENGDLYLWGAGDFGQIGADELGECNHKVVPTKLIPFDGENCWVQLDGGNWHTAALNDAGEVYTWGAGGYGQLGHLTRNNLEEIVPVPTKVEFPDEDVYIVNIACGDTFTSALTSDGELYCWGANNNGQLGFSSKGKLIVPHPRLLKIVDNEKILDISAGTAHMVAIKFSENGIFEPLYQLLKTGLLSDFSLEAYGQTFHLHKCILSVRSPLILENLVCPDVDLIAYKAYFLYVYTGKITTDLSFGLVQHLLLLSEVYNDQHLKIWCENYNIFDGEVLSYIPNQSSPNQEYGQLLHSGNYSDFIIENTEQELFDVHKCILAVRSTFFEATFRSGMDEAINGYLKLPDVHSYLTGDIIYVLLKYFYTDSFEDIRSMETAVSIFISSQFFGLFYRQNKRLIKYCAKVIIKKLTVENALNIVKSLWLSLGVYPPLKNDLLQFVVRNYRELSTDLPMLPQIIFNEINVAFNLTFLDYLENMQME
eukprot:TRINITY_DN3637_c0_g1_i1.p1 TRINITY_DN3637_c0_g1~~TRINITY_DN3637_c0_g1_i1.p1  ORF type:complete len:484 (+),score=96.25 TRINITY_DN3637_c0_g1_i1:703-2154(+)